MASSAGNHNQAGPFDVQMLFKQSNRPPTQLSPNIPSPSPPFSLAPPSSYPPPTTGGPYSYPPQSTPFHHHYLPPYQQQQDDHLANMHHHQSPISYPPQQQQPPLPSPNPNPGARLMALLTPTTKTNSPLQATVSSLPATSEYAIPVNPRTLVEIPSVPSSNFALPQPTPSPTPSRLPSTSSKLPRGRKLTNDHVVYDIDVRMQGERQPQLEVTPITKYVSDPALVVGRQIAVNKSYICYGLKLGAIRILNINTALRSLLRGHTQRVTDMAFFNEEVHLLASASIDGRVFVWKINEGSDAEDKPQITGHIVVAIQIVGEGESVHPRVCWHCHKQEFLVVGIGNHVLKINTTKFGKNVFSAEEPQRCSVDKLIDGVQSVGKHDGEVTDLSMCQWMTTRLASASVDGMVKIWDDRKAFPLAVLRPHDGQPVYSAMFLTAHQPQHINLITAGPLNQQIKIWTSTSEEGWLLPSDTESWQCTQTLELKSSAEPHAEDAFFNQVVALPQAGLILLANAKKNAIYAVHIDYGPYPAATRMDYIAEFTVTMPILSLTGTSDCSPDGEHVVQVYCVQTQAIQQYALDLSQCLPPMLESMGSGKVDSSVYLDVDMPSSEGFDTGEPPKLSVPTEMPVVSDTSEPPKLISSSEGGPVSRFTAYPGVSEVPSVSELASSVETKQAAAIPATDASNVRAGSPPLPLSPRLSRKASGFRNPSNSSELPLPLSDRGVDQPVLDYSVDRSVDTGDSSKKDSKEVAPNDISVMPNPPIMFKHPTHLITPSEILSMAVSSYENTQVAQVEKDREAKVQDMVVRNDAEGVEIEVKVIEENESFENAEVETKKEPHILVAEKKVKTFVSQASDLSAEMARECCARSTETLNLEKRQVHDAGVIDTLDHPSNVKGEETEGPMKEVLGKVSESDIAGTVEQSFVPSTKVKKQKGKNSQASGPTSPSQSPFDSTDSSNEPGSSPGVLSVEVASSQILSIQETLNQLITMQKEMQKQMTMMVAVPVTKEGRRIEAALGRSMEKAIRTNTDAVWARFQEESAKHEKLERDRTQQITSLISNFMNKDLPSMLEKTLKKELAVFGQAVARLVTPAAEKTISLSVMEAFQRGVGDKAVTQLEKSVNSKLEATVARQIQAQFQTSGKQALQDALRSSLEASVIPTFEVSCKAMFEQVDAVFQKGIIEHTTAVQQQFESTHSPLALALRDAISSASTITQTLTGELADGQRKLLALAAAGTNSKAVNPLATQLSNGPLGGIHEIAMPIQQVEAPLDPTKELSRLISEGKFEEAFTGALQRSDVSIVSWLCSQVDLQRILSMLPLPLSQGVLLALLQQLACDISKETSQKLTWMREVAVVINPADPMIAMHVRPIFEQVYQILGHHRTVPTTSAAEATSIRLVMHVINSMLMSCK